MMKYQLTTNIEVNLSNIHVTDEMTWREILTLNLNKSCKLDEMHPQLVDHVSKPLALLLIKIKDDRCIPRD